MKDQSLRRVEIFGREVVNANLEKLLSSFGFIRSDLPTQRPRKGLRVVLPTVGGKGAKVVGSSLLLSGKVSPAMELWLMYGSSASNMAGFSTKLMMKDSRTDAYDWILSLDVKHEAESGSGIAD